jgi:soluble lytic murein transglycosylase
LAVATLAVGEAEDAAASFRQALEEADDASGDSMRSLRSRVGLADALARMGREVEAAQQYLAAAAPTPELSHWLRLSALQAFGRAGLPDSALAVAAELRGSRAVRRDSVWLEVALAAFRAGDAERALAFSDSLSRHGRAALAGKWIVPTLLAAGDTAAARSEASRAVRAHGIGPEAGEWLIALDSAWLVLRRVAGSELREGRPKRAEALLHRAIRGAPPEERAALQLQLAEALFASGVYRQVGQVLAPWIRGDGVRGETGDPGPVPGAAPARASTLAEMRYLAGRALYRRGLRDRAIAVWNELADLSGQPDAAYASYLIADIYHDRGELELARSAYERTVARHPRAAYGAVSLIRLGMLALLQERSSEAVAHFDTYRRRFPAGSWSHAAAYWAARAREPSGDSAAARSLYRQVLEQDPISYYGIQAGRALGLDPWEQLPLRATPALPPLPEEHARLLKRMNLLRAVGWKPRALRELSVRQRQGETWTVRLALARALNEAGWTWQGTAIGWQVWRSRSGQWSDDLLRAVYPLIYEPVLRDVAEREGLDPALLAALVRRESQFDRDVVSRASAVGLMQLIPVTGAGVAREMGLTDYNRDQLGVPEVNLVLGSRHLRDLLARHDGSLVPALISYNAGPHRYARWSSFPEFSADAELMIDRIPFSETRRYVKALIAYRYIYGKLYGLGSSRTTGGAVDGSGTTG